VKKGLRYEIDETVCHLRKLVTTLKNELAEKTDEKEQIEHRG